MQTCKNCKHEIKGGAGDYIHFKRLEPMSNNLYYKQCQESSCSCTNPEPILILPESRKAKAEHSKAITDDAGFNNPEPKDVILNANNANL